MFDTLKHWFDSLEAESKLFDHPDDEVLHVALASMLYHIIAVSGHTDAREKHEFDRILQQEFALEQAQTDHLYQAAKASTGDLRGDLHTINFYLRKNPVVRMHFMHRLLQIIDVHGASEAELDVFFEALHEVFPEVREIRGDAGI